MKLYLRYMFIIGVLLAALSLTVPVVAQAQLPWPTDSWEQSTPEAQGMDSTKLADLWTFLHNPSLKETLLIHSLLIIRHGMVVMDASVDPFNSIKPHETMSMTKSFLSALVGIAIDQGYIKSVDQSIWDFFPKDKTAEMNDNKAAVTLRHLLNHTSGIGIDDNKWIGKSFEDKTVVQYLLNSRMFSAPGKTYRYIDGNSHLVSALLQKATRMSVLDFARKNLFQPLGITDVDWTVDADGINTGGWGLTISAQDIARLGYLYLHGGMWNDRQIVSSEWIKESVTDQLEPLQPHFWEGYSNYWYNGPYGYWNNEPAGKKAAYRGYAAIGYAGQSLFVMPDLDMIVVTTGDTNYNMVFANGLTDYVIPSVQSDTDLPANPTGNTRLQEVIHNTEQPIIGQVELPPVAAIISGKIYKLADNKLGWNAIGFTFDNQKEALLHLEVAGKVYDLPIGLDGVFRTSNQPIQSKDEAIWWHTCPWFIKGQWIEINSKSVLRMEIWDQFGQNAFMVSFSPDTLTVKARGLLWSEQIITIKAH